jgi:acyl carrier protein
MGSLNEIIAEVLEVAPSELFDDLGPRTHAEWSSMKHIKLVVAIEDEYGVSLSHQEIREMLSVGQAREILLAKGISV